MKVLLIFPPVRLSDVPRNFPTGLGIIASVIRNDGHDVKVLDINGNRFSKTHVENYIKKEDFDIAGIGGLLTVYNYLKWLIPVIRKKDKKIPVIVGGGIGSNIPELCLLKSGADIVVDGEGEITISRLLKALENKNPIDDITGLWIMKDNRPHSTGLCERVKDLDAVPWPAWDLFPMEKYLENPIVGFGKDLDLISSRGCPYRCAFCYKIGGRLYRQMSVPHLIKEIKNIVKKYNVDFISFQDNEFMLKRKWLKDFCNKMMEEQINIKWACTGRVNLIDEELLKLMKKAGCTSVSFGIESGSQEMLNIMKKDVTVKQAIKSVNLVKETGLRCPCSFIIGFPGETKETIEETIDFCKAVNIRLTSVMFATPYPGTELFDTAQKAGRVPEDLDGLDLFISKLGDCVDFVVNLTEEFSDEELKKMRDYAIEQTGKNYVPEPTGERRGKFMKLFGKKVYNELLKQLKDEKNIRHLELHGFNDIFELDAKSESDG